jgi:hypothetical protein
MTFTIPEREFLRQVAMVEPSWDAMKKIAMTACDWGELQRTAMLHQLGGVLAWRLQDERLVPAVPDIVRERGVTHLRRAKRQSAPLLADLLALLAIVQEQGWPYAIHGGASQYLPLAIPHIPRVWGDIDIEIDCSAEELRNLIDSLSLRVMPSWPGLDLVECRFPSGTWLDFQRNRWPGWSFRDDVREVTVEGMKFKIPAPEHLVYGAAWQTGQQVLRKACRLPLWGLARLKAWTEEPTFSWDTFERLLATGPDIDPYDEHGNPPSVKAVWTLDIADEVYGVYPDGLDLQRYREPIRCATLDVAEARIPTVADAYEHVVCEWADEEVPAERLLFDLQLIEGVRQRLASGLWREGAAPRGRYERLESGGWRRTIQERGRIEP